MFGHTAEPLQSLETWLKWQWLDGGVEDPRLDSQHQ